MEKDCICIYICSKAGKAQSFRCLKKAAAAYAALLRNPSAPRGKDDWRIEKGKYGKPFFPEYPWMQYSVSHSGTYWCCAFAPNQVGLDIQQIQSAEKCPPARTARIAERFFHPSEREYLLHGGSFFRVWAAKESYVKYTGEGITQNFASFAVADANGLLPAVMGAGRAAVVHSYILHPAYELCVCSAQMESVRFYYI